MKFNEQKHFSLCRWTVAGFRHSCSELKNTIRVFEVKSETLSGRTPLGQYWRQCYAQCCR